jgi:hypothetical protein
MAETMTEEGLCKVAREIREGLLEEVAVEQRLNDVKEVAMEKSGGGKYSRQKDQQMQRLWGRRRPGQNI